MSAQAVPISKPGGRGLKHLIVDQLQSLLEHRPTRFAVVGGLLVVGSLSTLVPTPKGVDLAWMFIVPVAVSAIAGGMKEGLYAASIAAGVSGIYATATTGTVDVDLIANVALGRMFLYGITAAILGAFADAHHNLQSHLRQLASLDPLTKLSNVARFYEELGIMEAGETRFAVMVVDLDDLKVLNDRHGHQTGSAAIQIVANCLRHVVRSSDCVARFGGDEFVVILRDADRAGAQIVMNRLDEMIAEEEIPSAPGERLSVSSGVAIFGEDGRTSEELLEAADAAMYVNKRARKEPLIPA